MVNFLYHVWRVGRDVVVNYFMPIVILKRWFTAPKGAKTISIERPWS